MCVVRLYYIFASACLYTEVTGGVDTLQRGTEPCSNGIGTAMVTNLIVFRLLKYGTFHLHNVAAGAAYYSMFKGIALACARETDP